MDKGGEMARKPAIVSLFDKYGVAIIRTALDEYHQNYSAEGHHI